MRTIRTKKFLLGQDAAYRAYKAYLATKKAFHESRQEIQDIKKGEEDPREDVPVFFGDEDED